MTDNKVILRSYGAAFSLERRLHRIDRFRIPLPYGISLAALGYAIGALLGVLLLGSLPVAGAALAAFPWPLRFILLPGAIAHLLCRPRADTRPGHEALVAYLVFLLAPMHLVGLAVVGRGGIDGQSLVVAADEHHATYHAATVRGPCTVLLRKPAVLRPRGRAIHLEPQHGATLTEPQEVVLAAGRRLEVAPCARP